MNELFKLLLKDLYNESSSTVRIALFKKFYNLAWEVDTELRREIFSVLYLHLKDIIPTTPNSNSEPTEEVQSLLDVLFKPDNNNAFIFNPTDVNLQGAHLQGANLQKANLKIVNLQGANLQNAILDTAQMINAQMQNAELQGAKLQMTNMLYVRINEKTHKTMPGGWEKIVQQHNGKTGAFLVDENDEEIENF